MPRPKHWEAHAAYLSIDHIAKRIKVVFQVPIPGSPEGTRRHIYHDMSPKEALDLAERLQSHARELLGE